MRQRAGFSLIEMVAAFGVISVTMVAIAVALSGLHRVQTRVLDNLPIQARWDRLAGQFRTDTHQCQQAVLAESAPGVPLLTLPTSLTQSVEYEWRRPVLERRVRRNREVIQREQFPFPNATRLAWSTESQPARVVNMHLEWTRDPAKKMPSPPSAAVISAAVGRPGTAGKLKGQVSP